MHYINLLKSPSLFSHLGIGVILLALACLPTKAKVVYGVDLDIIYLGPILALLIGVWSLPSLLLGTIESSGPKKTTLSSFTLTLSIANVILALLVWQYVQFPYSEIIPFIAPCVATDMITLCHFATDRKVANVLKNPRARALLMVTLAMPPILVMVGNLAQGTIFY